jgi:holin-like protein
MIPGLVQILLWQGVGELISHFFLPILPGPVLGLILLLGFLIIKGQVNAPLAMVSDAFVPAAVGVILFLPQLKVHAFAIITALLVSVVLTITTTALIVRLLAKKDSSGS